MVEGADELYVAAQEHTVAEHVARHVPDTDDGEVLVLDVLAELPEVAAHRLPGSPRRYPHLLVVVADGATRGEGVAEPEAVLGREAVGDVREGRRALVRRDDEVGVVIVVARNVGRRDDLVARDIVRNIQHATDQGLVTGYDLLLQGLAASFCGRALHHETTLRPDGDYHGVLHRLGLHEAEDLGPEVLAPVRPADPAAGDLSAAQVYPLGARGVDEDLEAGQWQRQARDPLGVELEREVRFGIPIRRALVVVRPQRSQGDVEERAQDAVLVQAHDLLEGFLDLSLQPPALRLSCVLARRIETCLEEIHDEPGYVVVVDEGVFHVVLGERRARLA